ncbi:hypothetical protein JHK87_044919 [Glycine soja]|nr:hypothetical protein JHK87_044919 [Glycine soja]
MVGTDDRKKEKITTFDIMGVCERKRKKKGNYSDDVDSNSVENVVAMWERRLSLKLLLAALNGKDSAVATCRFCRLMVVKTITGTDGNFARRVTLVKLENHSLHAFKGDNVLIYMSKMTMSSVIACLQKAIMIAMDCHTLVCDQVKLSRFKIVE